MIKIRNDNGSVITVPTLKGAAGKSAYEYAVAGGYQGSEQDFIDFLNNTTNIMNEHKIDTSAHSDIRNKINELKDELNVLDVAGTASNIVNAHTMNDSAHSDIRQNLAYVYNESVAVKETSGSPILLTDSADSNLVDFKAYGRSTQNQYSGKNLLPNTATSQTINGATFTVNADKSITVNGTFTASTELILGNLIVESGSYILSGSPVADGTYGIRLYNGPTHVASDTGNGYVYNIDTESTLRVSLFIPNGKTLTNVKFYPMLRLASIEDDTYEPYVGGTASPNPNFPQEIKSVGDCGWFDGELLQGYYDTSGTFISTSNYICSKNLIICNAGDTIKLSYATNVSSICFVFYDDNMNVLSRPSNTDSNGFTEYEAIAPENAKYVHFMFREVIGNVAIQSAKKIVVTINDKYTVKVKTIGKNLLNLDYLETIGGKENVTVENGTITIAPGDYVYGIKFSNANIGLEVSKTYTFSAKNISSEIPLGGYRFGYIDGTYGALFGTTTTQTISKEVKEILFYISTPYTGTTDVIFSNMQIEIGDVATEYEPYTESIKYIPVSEPLRSIGDVKDEVDLTEGKITRRFKEVVFDGSDDEGWVLLANTSTINTNIFRIYPSKKAKNSPILCNYFKYYIGNNEDFEHTRFTVETYPALAIWVNKTRANTIDEWKAQLQANPIKVIYELAEPAVETIDPVNIYAFDNISYITATDDAEMKIKYYRNNVYGETMSDITDRVNINTETIDSKAPINHAASTNTYGAGSPTEYGHVKVSDSYKTSDGTASTGVAASSKAVADAYADIKGLISGLEGGVGGSLELLDSKVDKTTTVNGKPLSSNITLSAGDVGADPSGSANSALTNAKSYTDTKVAGLVDSAPETMNTLNELATAIKNHQSVTDALNSAITNKVDKVSGKGLSTNDYTTDEKNKLNGIAAGANAYTHPTTSGNKHIPSGGSSGQVLKWSADGTAVWANESSNITIDSALSNTSTNPVQNKVINTALAGKANSSHTHTASNIADLTATATELNYMKGVTSSVQTQLDSKPDNIEELCKHTAYTGDINTLSAGMYVYQSGSTYASNNGSASGGFAGWCRIYSVDTSTGFCNVISCEYRNTWIKASAITHVLTSTEAFQLGQLSQIYLTTGYTNGIRGTENYYGITKLSDNYTTSAGAASSSIGASSKAVADLYNHIINKLKWTSVNGIGTSVHYNMCNLRMRLVGQSYSIEAGANDRTSFALPSNIKANIDIYFQAIALNANWKPQTGIVYGCVIGGTSTIEIRSSITLSGCVLLADIMEPAGFFTIT